MAASVFGFTITADTLRATGEYEEPITQKDVAEYTMKMINADGKDKEAQQFVDNLKERFVVNYFCFFVLQWYRILGSNFNFDHMHY
jgi:hypothetical protein